MTTRNSRPPRIDDGESRWTTSSTFARGSGLCCRPSSRPASCPRLRKRSTPPSRRTSGTAASPVTPESATRPSSGCTRAPDVTIKWVQQDPLVMNGEPFCYGSRLTVRQLLELRSNGYDLGRILTDHPELRTVGVAAAFTYAAAHQDRYADFFE